MEENKRMGKTRDLVKKIRDTKGRFHENIGSIKDIHGMDLREAEGIRRGGKNTQKNQVGYIGKIKDTINSFLVSSIIGFTTKSV